MERQALFDLLQRRPFEPFSIHFSSGEFHEVRHPELAALGRSRLVIFHPATDEMIICALLHITSVHTLQGA